MKKTLFLLGLTAFTCIGMFLRTGESDKPILVDTATVLTQDLVRRVDASGELREYRSRSLSAGGYAVVDDIYVNVGDTVREGQVLMTLSPLAAPTVDDALTSALVSAGMDAAVGEAVSVAVPELFTSEIVAPFDGVVTSITTQSGEQVVPLIPAVSVSDTSRIRAVVRLDATAATEVEVGMPAVVRLTANRRTYEGVVTSVSPIIKTSTSLTGAGERYCEAEVELYTPDGFALSGSPVTVKVSTAVRTDAVLAPYEAIKQSDSGQEYLFVLRDNRAVRTNVTVGEESDSWVEILSGLSATATVIVDSAVELNDGVAVRVAP